MGRNDWNHEFNLNGILWRKFVHQKINLTKIDSEYIFNVVILFENVNDENNDYQTITVYLLNLIPVLSSELYHTHLLLKNSLSKKVNGY